MKHTFALLCWLSLLLMSSTGSAQQRYFAESASITFFSDGVIEDIKGVNSKATSILDVASGDVAYLLSIKDFQFAKKLMQVHFNEKYMESDKYPKSSFQGKVTGYDHNNTGTQQVKAIGKLTIHGVTKDVQIQGTIERKGSELIVRSKFLVKLQDYNIRVPQIVWQNIAQQVEVTMDINYRPL